MERKFALLPGEIFTTAALGRRVSCEEQWMTEMSLQVVKKSALAVVPVASDRKGPDIRSHGVNRELKV
jgi:hypothetical protein